MRQGWRPDAAAAGKDLLLNTEADDQIQALRLLTASGKDHGKVGSLADGFIVYMSDQRDIKVGRFT
jgi:hypothetical protein